MDWYKPQTMDHYAYTQLLIKEITKINYVSQNLMWTKCSL